MAFRPAAVSPRIVTGGLAIATTAWLFLLVFAPYLVSHARRGSPLFVAGGVVYLAGHVVCHQRADRSFHEWGVQLPVCGRCFGLYAAAVAGSLLAAWRATRQSRSEIALRGVATTDKLRRWRARLILAALPTAGSVALEVSGVWAQSPVVRCIAALPLGFTVAWFVGACYRL